MDLDSAMALLGEANTLNKRNNLPRVKRSTDEPNSGAIRCLDRGARFLDGEGPAVRQVWSERVLFHLRIPFILSEVIPLRAVSAANGEFSEAEAGRDIRLDKGGNRQMVSAVPHAEHRLRCISKQISSSFHHRCVASREHRGPFYARI